MVDSSGAASPAQVVWAIHRAVAIAVLALLTSAAFAGILPGSTVFLGLLSADPPLTLARIVLVAVLLTGLRHPASPVAPPPLKLALGCPTSLEDGKEDAKLPGFPSAAPARC